MTEESNSPIEEEFIDELTEEAGSSTVVDMPVDLSHTPASTSQSQQKNRKKVKGDGGGVHFKENPYTFISPDDPIVQSCMYVLSFLSSRAIINSSGLISATFNLTSKFPASNILVRNPEGEPVRSMYMTNDIVKSIVQNNDYARIRLTTCGTKVFGKQEGSEAKRDGADSHFRVLSEGLPVILPYIGPDTVINADVAALKVLMESYYPLFTSFPESFQSLIEPKSEFIDLKDHSLLICFARQW